MEAPNTPRFAAAAKATAAASSDQPLVAANRGE
jgi:hypothetical protein